MIKIIAIIMLLFVSASAQSDIILKYGRVASDKPDDTTFGGVWLEQDNCAACLSLFGVEFHTEDPDAISNRIAGIDFTQKILRTTDANVRLSFGYSIAETAINDSENFNFHLGAGMQVKLNQYIQFGLFYDHFSNGRRILDRVHIEKNEPLDMLSIGFIF